MAPRWTHVTITVSDLEKSVAFYRDVCGLALVRDRRKEGGATVWMGPPPAEGKDPEFVLVMMQGVVEDRIDHLGFQVESRAEVDAKAALGRERGILQMGPKDSGGSVGYWVILNDPDGHGAEFTFGQPLQGLA